MKREKPYNLLRSGNVFLVQATVGSGNGKIGKARLLIDTGASNTILPVEVIEKLGYNTHHSSLHTVRLTSANGIVIAPLVTVSWFNCLGQLLKSFSIVAHTIPEASFDGLLGMDFLTRCRAVISVGEAEISCRKSRPGRS